MTRFLILITAASAALMASAETSEKTAVPETPKTLDSSHFGVRAQLDFNRSANTSEVFKWGPGASVGVSYYTPVNRLLYFNMALLFSYDTLKFDGWGGTKYSKYYMDGSLYVPGMRLPLDLGIKLLNRPNIMLGIYTGPNLYFNFGCKAKYLEIHSEWSGDIDKKYTYSGMEIGWKAGLACDFMRHWHIHFEYMYGLSNMAMTNDITGISTTNVRRMEMSLGLGYNF